jgi:hypothetical protein
MSCDMPDFETLIMDGRISIRRALGAPRTSASALARGPSPRKIVSGPSARSCDEDRFGRTRDAD